MKSSIVSNRFLLLLLVIIAGSTTVVVQGKEVESVAELRHQRRRGLGGWNGGDNGRDHPGMGQHHTEEAASTAVEESSAQTGEEVTVRPI